MEVDEVPDGEAQASDGAVPLEVLERRLTARAAELAAAEAEWMSWLAEYDRRRGWAEWGCSGPAHWLSWKCGMSPSAARERVRVATALVDLPLVQSEFAAGKLSYSKVQAITRVANEFNEAELVGLAVNATGAQLSRICAGYRSSMETSEADALARLGFTKRRNHDGTCSYTLCVLEADSQRIDDHVQGVVDDLIADGVEADESPQGAVTRREAIADRGGIAAVRAQAVALLLTGDAESREPTPAEVTLIVDESAADHECNDACAQAQHLDADVPDTDSETATAPTREPHQSDAEPHPVLDTCAQAPSTADATADDELNDVSSSPKPGCSTCAQARGEHLHWMIGDWALSPASGRRLTCDPRIQTLIESADAGPLAVGRTTRVISRAMRRALKRRAGGACAFPGCHATRHLHAHHIIHWVDGGPTELDNLILVCHFHHHLVHEGGWSVDQVSRTFRRPDGTAVDPTPEHLRAGVAPIEPRSWPGAGAGSGPLEPPNMSPFDLPWTTTVIHHNEAIRRANHQRLGAPPPKDMNTG